MALSPERDDESPSGRYTSGDYELVVTESSPDSLSSIIRWEIKERGTTV